MEKASKEKKFVEMYNRISKKYKMPDLDEFISVVSGDFSFSFVNELHFVVDLITNVLRVLERMFALANDIVSPRSYFFFKINKYLKESNKLEEADKLGADICINIAKYHFRSSNLKKVEDAVQLFNEVFGFTKSAIKKFIEIYEFDFDNGGKGNNISHLG
ncbi:MAG: hypothetical protein QXP36_04115 [Conexivisphaerales archaeon]